ncbi:MAG: flagellin lysine-N-methylase, partial [Eubacteriales bacterium]|nr:flagellin lysine-N-methylase [Eubacteriales bacterium]
MKLYQPTCWKPFQCTASQCGDNCCIGWEIDIDPNSYARYQAVSGAFGDTLRANIQSGETPCFKMIEERCAMLDGENLCQIYRRWGKEGLCQICRDHPLFTDTFGTRR